MQPQKTLPEFDRYLAGRGLQLHAVVLGGTALNLLGVVFRPTRDCDVLVPELPTDVVEAARRFAQEQRGYGEQLDDDWLNNGAAALQNVLPAGWRSRLVVVFTGVAIELHSLGRADLLATKLFALCDRGLDIGDCIALAPTAAELTAILPWLEEQDANREWPAHVRAVLADLAKRLGHGV